MSRQNSGPMACYGPVRALAARRSDGARRTPDGASLASGPCKSSLGRVSAVAGGVSDHARRGVNRVLEGVNRHFLGSWLSFAMLGEARVLASRLVSSLAPPN